MTTSERGFDVVIVGGGINGAGIARDAAMRGLRVLLLEQNDFGSGTSSWSSRLIHGGLRYLEFGEIPLVYESLRERRVLQETAPHLVKRLRINIPVFDHSKRGMLMLRAGMIAYDLLSLGKPIPHHRVLGREELLHNEPGINPNGLRGGVQYFDAQVAYAERLVLENIVAAVEAGAVVRNYSRVTAVGVRDGRVQAVRYQDRRKATDDAARAKVVVNAAGPWVDRVLEMTGLPAQQLIGGTKGSHIVINTFPGAPQDAFYVEARADARPIFIIPWNSQYLIGTTDTRYEGDPSEARATPAEIDYLLSETNRVFPAAGVSADDINYTYAGVRPLPHRSSGPESAITRKHIIRHHGDAQGLWSVIGGKLTTYRSLAEDAVDRIVRKCGYRVDDCRTRDEMLPGARQLVEAGRELQRLPQLSANAKERLLSVYGGRVLRILQMTRDEPQLLEPAVPEQVLAAEIAFNVREELAQTLEDILHRRTMTGLAPDLGTSMAQGIATAAARELGWSAAETAQQLESLNAYNDRLRLAGND